MRTSWLIGDRMVDSFLFVGLIADTHGLMRPEALDALQKADLIIHAGDIGKPAVLDGLQNLAPVRAIRGNNDRDPWALSLPTHDTVKIGAHTLYVLHDITELALDPRASGFSVVISGHSHKPEVKTLNQVLFVNPGSAGPRRFALPVTVAVLALRSDRCDASIIQLM
jgi:putative phosphoesterase